MEDYRKLYSNCRLCPRKCGVDRRAGETGFCGESGVMRVAWAGLHKGEEPPVTGEKGSGTIFFYRMYPPVRLLSKPAAQPGGGGPGGLSGRTGGNHADPPGPRGGEH